MEQIQNYPIISTGKSKNLQGLVFGDYLVLYRTTPPQSSQSQQAHWLCQCVKCKKYLIKSASTLTKGKNVCDCIYDLTGKKIGRWLVEYKTDKRTKKRDIIWHCKCECGNEKDVNGEALRKGESQSCGCLAKEKASETVKKTRLDLANQTFGKLTALYPIYSGEENTHTRWICKCECGNIVSVDLGNLRSGKSQSCGCVRSSNEERIIKMLINNNKEFNYQHTFSDLPSKSYDFYIENKYIIEFDGLQHFKYSETGWSTKENYERTHANDLIKNKYCFEHNIPIIRIPYDEEYYLDDLKLETTRFLLTPENEQEYYNKHKEE